MAQAAPARIRDAAIYFFKIKLYNKDTLAEWLRRRPAKPLGYTRAGSNPAGVEYYFYTKYYPRWCSW